MCWRCRGHNTNSLSSIGQVGESLGSRSLQRPSRALPVESTSQQLRRDGFLDKVSMNKAISGKTPFTTDVEFAVGDILEYSWRRFTTFKRFFEFYDDREKCLYARESTVCRCACFPGTIAQGGGMALPKKCVLVETGRDNWKPSFSSHCCLNLLSR